MTGKRFTGVPGGCTLRLRLEAAVRDFLVSGSIEGRRGALRGWEGGAFEEGLDLPLEAGERYAVGLEVAFIGAAATRTEVVAEIALPDGAPWEAWRHRLSGRSGEVGRATLVVETAAEETLFG